MATNGMHRRADEPPTVESTLDQVLVALDLLSKRTAQLGDQVKALQDRLAQMAFRAGGE